ncbi:hypothetical protein CHS0354_025899 [Potamilus streckersoni]|uniref:ZP domain-containing protein n=1 Tax=Potamilus streckersoni TaxID=2493646 RepID=A0AAE0WDJ5_9BIVA|nr:hypothetical protein CHS0354_025899 [Potamilus streckersoni]
MQICCLHRQADGTLIDKANDGKQGEITIEVYAFHFIGSSDVTYQCTVLVCPDTTCRQNQTNTSGRKRRAASVRSEQVETSIKVLGKYDLNEITVSSAEKTGAALFLLIASMTLLRPLF